ncbi:MAG TPA: hypothetical protein VFB84_00350 [Micromonosporaceae bacterium]|nr:hypothetical protein [Micromonosporaceae bacterium]
MEHAAEAATAALTDFFDRYGNALIAGDLPTIAACYAMPGLVVTNDATFSFATPAAVETAFAGAAETYHAKRLVAARADVCEVSWLTPALALASVTWEYLDARGWAVPGESYRYLLRVVGDKLAICVVVPAG